MTKKRQGVLQTLCQSFQAQWKFFKKPNTTNSHKDLTTNFTTSTMSTGSLYQLQWLLMKENYSKNNQT